jgi:hypothetical protein
MITFLRAQSYLNASLMLIIWMRPYLLKSDGWKRLNHAAALY